MTIKFSIIIISIIFAIVFDIILGISNYPILTIIVCGIVILYEYISPFIYKSH